MFCFDENPIMVKENVFFHFCARFNFGLTIKLT